MLEPISTPFSQTVKHESTPSKRSTLRIPAQPSGTRKRQEKYPVGFSLGTLGGSSGNGYCTLV